MIWYDPVAQLWDILTGWDYIVAIEWGYIVFLFSMGEAKIENRIDRRLHLYSQFDMIYDGYDTI